MNLKVGWLISNTKVFKGMWVEPGHCKSSLFIIIQRTSLVDNRKLKLSVSMIGKIVHPTRGVSILTLDQSSFFLCLPLALLKIKAFVFTCCSSHLVLITVSFTRSSSVITAAVGQRLTEWNSLPVES